MSNERQRALDRQFDIEHDRRLMNPDYKDSYDKEFDRQAAAYDAMNEYYEPRVVTDFSSTCYKPGQKVKWLGKYNEMCEGAVIGATVVDAHGEPDYVILSYTKDVVVVCEIALRHGWDGPPTTPAPPPPTRRPNVGVDDEIPF